MDNMDYAVQHHSRHPAHYDPVHHNEDEWYSQAGGRSLLAMGLVGPTGHYAPTLIDSAAAQPQVSSSPGFPETSGAILGPDEHGVGRWTPYNATNPQRQSTVELNSNRNNHANDGTQNSNGPAVTSPVSTPDLDSHNPSGPVPPTSPEAPVIASGNYRPSVAASASVAGGAVNGIGQHERTFRSSPPQQGRPTSWIGRPDPPVISGTPLQRRSHIRPRRLIPPHHQPSNSTGSSGDDFERDHRLFIDDIMTGTLIGEPSQADFEAGMPLNQIILDPHGLSRQITTSDDPRLLRQAQLMRGAASSNKRVASKRTLDSMLKVDLKDLQENEKTCVICYNDFGVESPEGINESPLRLPRCRHVFGDHCIKKWFEDSDNCPYCRDKLHSEPKYGSTRRSLVNMLRYRPTPFAHDELEGREEAVLRSTRSPGDTHPALGRTPSGERRSPPDDTNEHQRRTRLRRSPSDSQEPTPSQAAPVDNRTPALPATISAPVDSANLNWQAEFGPRYYARRQGSRVPHSRAPAVQRPLRRSSVEAPELTMGTESEGSSPGRAPRHPPEQLIFPDFPSGLRFLSPREPVQLSSPGSEVNFGDSAARHPQTSYSHRAW